MNNNMTPEEEKAAIAQIQADVEAHPELYAAKDDGKFNWEDIGVGGYNVTNSALFGIPDVLVKAASSDVYKELQQIRARNKAASMIGDIGGAFLPTGGALVGTGAKALKGASAAAKGAKAVKTAETLEKAAKAADTVSDIIKGTKELKGISGGLARGALTAGEQILPRALAGETEGKDALTGIALGAGIGGAAKAVPSVLRSAGVLNKGESFTKPLEDVLVDKELAARGISGRDIRLAINKTASTLGLDRTGMAVNNAEDVKKAALDILKKNDILNADEAQAFIQGTGKKFEVLNKAFDESGQKLSDYADDIYNEPVVKDFIDEYGDEGKKYVGNLLTKLDKKSGLNGIKQELMKNIQFANKSTDAMTDASGDVAAAIKDKLDDIVLKFDPNYDQYKAEWKALQPLRYMTARDKISIAKAAGGSDTAAKMLVTSALGGGAGVTSAIKDFDSNDPTTWTPAAIKAIAGFALGAAANKTIPGLTNFTTGKIAAALNNPTFLKAAEKAGYNLSKIPVESLSQGTTKFLTGKLASDTPEEAIAKELAKDGQLDIDTAAKAAGSEVSETIKDAQETKEQQFGPEYVSKLNEAMLNYWAENFSDEMDFADYAQAVAEKTNGFDPEKSASFLYPNKDERKKFLRDLKISKKLNELDLEKTFGKSTFGESFFAPETVKEKKFAQDNAVDAIASLITKEGDIPSKSDIQVIKADVQAIMGLNATKEEKRQLLFEKLQDKYGLDYQNLSALGLA